MAICRRLRSPDAHRLVSGLHYVLPHNSSDHYLALTLHVDDHAYNQPYYSSGHYVSPTLLIAIIPSTTTARKELFAPICTVIRTSFNLACSRSSAIQIINSTPYALGASVFGTNSCISCALIIASGFSLALSTGKWFKKSAPQPKEKGKKGGKEGWRFAHYCYASPALAIAQSMLTAMADLNHTKSGSQLTS